MYFLQEKFGLSLGDIVGSEICPQCYLVLRSEDPSTVSSSHGRLEGRGSSCGSKKTLVMIFSHAGQAPILLTGRLGPVPREDNILATTVLGPRLLRTHCGAQPWVGKRVIRREFMSRPFYSHPLIETLSLNLTLPSSSLETMMFQAIST